MARGPQPKKSQGTPRPWLSPLLGALALLCAVLPYLPTVGYDFVWDDRVLVGPQLDVRGASDVGRLWNLPFDSILRDTPGRGSYFRPVVLYSLAADRALHGDRPGGYHATNVAWYALAVLLLWLFLRDWTGRPLAATAGATLFALHPAHPESVAFVSGRTDVIAGAFVFGSLWASARWGPRIRPAWARLIPASLVLLPGLFAKEIAMFAAPLPLLALWLKDRRVPARTLAAAAIPLLATALLYYVCRIAVLGLAPLPPVTPVEGSLSQALTSLQVLARYTALLLVPAGLSAWHEVPHILRPDAIAIAGLLALALLLAGLAAALRRRSAWSLPLALVAVTLLPVCWVRILSGSLVAERLLFLPSAGVALAVALLADRGARRPADPARRRPADAGPALLGACAAASVVFGLLLAERVPVWRDEGTLYGSMLRASPGSPFVHAALGGYYYRTRDLPRAVIHHRRAYELQPNHTDALLNIAAAQEEMGQLDSAFVAIRELVRLRAEYAAAWYALGNLQVKAGAPDSAVAAYGTALRLDPRFAQAENNLGVAFERMGRRDEALVHYRRAGELMPGYREAEGNRTRLEAELGRKP